MLRKSRRAEAKRAGECFRLYTKQAFDKLEEYDVPEIQRCNLASAVLQLVAMGQNPFDFDYIDNPGQDPSECPYLYLSRLTSSQSKRLFRHLLASERSTRQR